MTMDIYSDYLPTRKDLQDKGDVSSKPRLVVRKLKEPKELKPTFPMTSYSKNWKRTASPFDCLVGKF